MAFEVILVHYWDTSNGGMTGVIQILSFFRMLAVPIFMLMSFILVGKYIIEGRNIRKRFNRLLVPHVGWAIIYFFILIVTDIMEWTKWGVGPKDLILQILTGESPRLCPQLWYQEVLIFLTALFYIVYHYFSKKKAMMITCLLMLYGIFMQYSGINYLLFSGLPYEAMYILGRTLEMLPYAFWGIVFAEFLLMNRVSDNKFYILIIGLTVCILLYNINFFVVCDKGFGYQGVNYIVMAIATVITFMAIPETVIPSYIQHVIDNVARYTLGIYCIHWGIGKYLNLFFENVSIRTNTLRECVLIFIISLLISVFIERIPMKFCKKLVR